jgi:DNA-binding SARP family transcriptional activator
MIRFQVLGPLRVLHDTRDCTPSASKARQVLALLLLRANQVVSTDALIEELWGERPPRSAVNTAQTYIYQLRRMFQRMSANTDDGVAIVTSAPGYRLRVRQDQWDVDRFLRLSEQGRTLFSDGEIEAAAARLHQALSLWYGQPFSNVAGGPSLDAQIEMLQERRMAVLRLRIRADALLGRQQDLVAELRTLARQHPFDEWLHGQLMLSLYNLGRRTDALAAYQRIRVVLRDQLGLDPSPDLCRIHDDILSGREVSVVGRS